MKTRAILSIGAAITITAAFSLPAEDAARDELHVRDSAQPHALQRLQNSGAPVKTSQLLGREIIDCNGRKIGKVRDFAIDLQNGRIVEVIAATGGFLGIKERDTAVPPGEFSWNPDDKKLVCQLDQEQLRNAPVFDLAHWPESVRAEKVRDIYHRYNIAPYFIDDHLKTPPSTEAKPATQLTSAALVAPTVHLGPVERMRDIMGAAVQDQGDERLGKVENVIVDLTSSRIIVLIVSTGGFLGMGDEVSAIPPQSFHYNEERSKLSMNTTPEALRLAPHYKPDQWPAVASSERIATVYNAYKVPPYQTETDADNTAQNVRDRSGGNLTPLDQGNSAADRAITARIRREIMARSDLSTDARNVKIITVGGQVTLRGPVKTQEEEAKIIEIARNAVSADTKVTNQIHTVTSPSRIKSDSPSDSN